MTRRTKQKRYNIKKMQNSNFLSDELHAALFVIGETLERTVFERFLVFPNEKSIALNDLLLEDYRKFVIQYSDFLNAESKIFRIENNVLYIKSDLKKSLNEYLITEFSHVVIPPNFYEGNFDMFYMRFITRDLYSEHIKSIFDFYIEKLTCLKIISATVQEVYEYQDFLNCVREDIYAWRRIISDLLYAKLKLGEDTTNYFHDFFAPIHLANWLAYKELPSLLTIQGEKLIVSQYQENHMELLPYIIALLDDGYNDLHLRRLLLFSYFNQN